MLFGSRQRFSDWKMHSTKANNRHHLITGTGRSLFLRFITVLYSTVSIERIEFGYSIRCHVPTGICECTVPVKLGLGTGTVLFSTESWRLSESMEAMIIYTVLYYYYCS